MGGQQVERAGGFGIWAESQGTAQVAQVRPASQVHGQERKRPGFQVDLQPEQRLHPGFPASGDELNRPGE